MKDLLEGIVAIFVLIWSLLLLVFVAILLNPVAWIIVVLILILNKMG